MRSFSSREVTVGTRNQAGTGAARLLWVGLSLWILMGLQGKQSEPPAPFLLSHSSGVCAHNLGSLPEACDVLRQPQCPWTNSAPHESAPKEYWMCGVL